MVEIKIALLGSNGRSGKCFVEQIIAKNLAAKRIKYNLTAITRCPKELDECVDFCKKF